MILRQSRRHLPGGPQGRAALLVAKSPKLRNLCSRGYFGEYFRPEIFPDDQWQARP